MINRFIGSITTFVFFLALLPAAQGQAGNRAIPRTADGKPDFSGIWQAMNTADWDILPHAAHLGEPSGLGVVEGGTLPYQPAALAKKKENFAHRATDDTESKCYLVGVPRVMYMPYPFQIFQTPKTVMMLFEYVNTMRNVYMDTAHPPGHIDWWMGDSRGKWDGDTLVVDAVDFNDETWFDKAGDPHSKDLHVVERYTLLDPDHINYEATIEDPKTYTKPWKMSFILYRHIEKNFQILEHECYTFEDEAAGNLTQPKSAEDAAKLAP